MKDSQRAKYLQELREAQDTFDEAVSNLGDSIRREIIIPLCKKHNLTFISGNGDFFFTDENNMDYGDYLDPIFKETSSKKLQNIQKVLGLLSTEVTLHQCLGYFVEDVDEEDYQ